MKIFNAFLFAAPFMLLATGLNAQGVFTNKANGGITPTALVNPGARPNAVDAARGDVPPNDLCTAVTAEVVVPGIPLVFTGTTTGATNAGDAEPGSALDLGGDTVFVFHRITLTGCADLSVAYCGTATQPAIYQAVLAPTCPMSDDLVFFSGGNFNDCPDGNATIFWTAVPAGTYYIPVRGEPATAGPYTLTINATACPLPPAYDDCATAIDLVSGATCAPTPFSTLGATQSLAPITCADFTSSNAFDAWFSFECTNATQTIGVVGFNAADAVVELFSGPGCDALTSLACADATFPMSATETTTEQLTQSGLTVGTTYFVRVYDYGHGSDEHNFEICVTEGAGSTIGINENEASLAFHVYPNPGSGLFNLEYTGENGAAAIQVMDVTGRVVHSWYGQVSANGVQTIDLTGMAAGNYTAQFTMNGVRTAQRLVVK
ncbi:MAG: T9SS type A sorting domain-containing protein [Flavobacteriales bacterium]